MTFNFAEKTREKLLSLPISEAIREKICTLEANGKTIKFLPIILDITEDSQLNDVYVLAEFRKENI